MFTWPGESRSGMVSLRLSWAVKPFAAHPATPRDPLPSGRNCVAEVLGRPSTTFERETIPPTLVENDPFCQAVVRVAAFAGVLEPNATADTAVRETAAAAALNRHSLVRLDMFPP